MKKKDKILYYYFSKVYLKKLKKNLIKKREYIYNLEVEKYDFIFDSYKDKIIKKMLEVSELKRRLLKKIFKRRALKYKIFKKIFIKTLSYRIKNELLLTI